MAARSKLVETNIVADLNQDSTLADYAPTVRDDRATQTAPVQIAVAAYDGGEFYPGSGIHKFRVEVTISCNEKAESVADGTLDDLEGRVCDRLPVQIRTPAVQGSGGGLDPADQRLTSSSLKVYGIQEALATPRTDAGMIRTRVVTRTLIGAQLV